MIRGFRWRCCERGHVEKVRYSRNRACPPLRRLSIRDPQTPTLFQRAGTDFYAIPFSCASLAGHIVARMHRIETSGLLLSSYLTRDNPILGAWGHYPRRPGPPHGLENTYTIGVGPRCYDFSLLSERCSSLSRSSQSHGTRRHRVRHPLFLVLLRHGGKIRQPRTFRKQIEENGTGDCLDEDPKEWRAPSAPFLLRLSRTRRNVYLEFGRESG